MPKTRGGYSSSRRGASSSSQSSQSENITNTFPTDHRTIYPGRRVIDREDFEDKIYIWLRQVGWENFTNGPSFSYYPLLVEQFYRNMCFQNLNNDASEPIIRSTVLGTRINLTLNIFSEIFGVPNAGEKKFFKRKDLKDHVQMNMPSYYGSFLNTHEIVTAMKISDIQPDLRFINLYINANILPTGGHRDEIPTFQGFILHCMKIGRKLNLPFIVLHYMNSCCNNTIRGRPYGAFLTKVFQYYRVECNDYYKCDTTDPISRTTLRLLESHPVRQRTPRRQSENNQEFDQHVDDEE